MKPENVLTRFSDRVDDYVKYRPGYPREVIEVIKVLKERCGLSSKSVIADVGSGPGNLARLFLEDGNEIFAVEPNAEMRAAGQELLGKFGQYHGIDGSAEDTHLSSSSIDFITAAQAFHWFDWPRARAEFKRILKPLGWVVLLWNDRRFESSPFQRDYEELLLEYGTDYAQVKAQGRAAADAITEFFSGRVQKVSLDNSQFFDLASLQGRLLSASYAPKPDHPSHALMLAELERIFHAQEDNALVAFEYDTNVYFGQFE
jgi:SAM-dependent methyltransferase